MRLASVIRWLVRVLGAGAGLALGALVIAPALPPLGAAGRGPVVLPDTTGAIEAMVVHATPDMLDAVQPAYEDLLRALPADVTVCVAVGERSTFDTLRERLAAAGTPGLDRLTPLMVGHPITTWAKDRFAPMRRPDGGACLLVPPPRSVPLGTRGFDALVPRLLAERVAGVEATVAPFDFDGGDLAIASDRCLVTPILLGRNPRARAAPQEFLATLERTLGRPVTLIGDAAEDVPSHHIGMFVALLEGGVALVGSVDRALEVAPEEARGAALDLDLGPASAALFEGVARRIEAEGLRVVRLPLLPVAGQPCYITYTNVVMETRDGRRRVYLPVYGLPALDEAATAAWRAEGFNVFPVRAASIWRYQGSLRCLVGVISRR